MLNCSKFGLYEEVKIVKSYKKINGQTDTIQKLIRKVHFSLGEPYSLLTFSLPKIDEWHKNLILFKKR